MRRKTQQTIAAFAATGILIMALCGFVAVDLSTDLYMPGQFGPLLQVNYIDSTGASLWLLGGEYTFSAEEASEVQQTLWQYRGLLPAGIGVTGNLTTRIYAAVRAYNEANATPEEPW